MENKSDIRSVQSYINTVITKNIIIVLLAFERLLISYHYLLFFVNFQTKTVLHKFLEG